MINPVARWQKYQARLSARRVKYTKRPEAVYPPSLSRPTIVIENGEYEVVFEGRGVLLPARDGGSSLAGGEYRSGGRR